MSFPRICFFALHPLAISRSSEVETLMTDDPAVCAAESAAMTATKRLMSATRFVAFTVSSCRLVRCTVAFARMPRGPRHEWIPQMIPSRLPDQGLIVDRTVGRLAKGNPFG